MTRNKKTGLAAFTQAKARESTPSISTPPSDPPKSARVRTRAKGETVALTVRLSREQWQKLHEFAAFEGTSLQELALEGFALVLQERGLKF
jgi:hypothetical protein